MKMGELNIMNYPWGPGYAVQGAFKIDHFPLRHDEH